MPTKEEDAEYLHWLNAQGDGGGIRGDGGGIKGEVGGTSDRGPITTWSQWFLSAFDHYQGVESSSTNRFTTDDITGPPNTSPAAGGDESVDCFVPGRCMDESSRLSQARGPSTDYMEGEAFGPVNCTEVTI